MSVESEGLPPLGLLVSEEAVLVGEGQWETELGLFADTDESWALTTGVLYGMREETELSLAWAPLQGLELAGQREAGVGDATLRWRESFDTSEDAPAVVLGAGAILPLGDEQRGLGIDSVQGLLDLTATWTRERHFLTAVAKTDFLDAGGGASPELVYGGAVSLGYLQPAGPWWFTELTASRTARTDDGAMSLLVGVAWAVSEYALELGVTQLEGAEYLGSMLWTWTR